MALVQWCCGLCSFFCVLRPCDYVNHTRLPESIVQNGVIYSAGLLLYVYNQLTPPDNLSPINHHLYNSQRPSLTRENPPPSRPVHLIDPRNSLSQSSIALSPPFAPPPKIFPPLPSYNKYPRNKQTNPIPMPTYSHSQPNPTYQPTKQPDSLSLPPHTKNRHRRLHHAISNRTHPPNPGDNRISGEKTAAYTMPSEHAPWKASDSSSSRFFYFTEREIGEHVRRKVCIETAKGTPPLTREMR